MSRLVARLVALAPESAIRRAAALQKRSPAAARLGRLAKRASAADATIPRGAAAGLRFNTFGTNVGYLTGTKELDIERAFTALLRPGAVVYDIGAAIGYYTIIAARAVGPEGRVVAFEPFPDNQERLRHNVALNGFDHVERHALAVGEEAGQATFRLGKAATQGRLASLPLEPESMGEGEITVEVATLDDLVASGRIPPPDAIKMDIEGAEVEALRGASRVLAEHGPALFMEMHGRAAEVAEILDGLGYVTSVVGDDRPLAESRWSSHVVARRP